MSRYRLLFIAAVILAGSLFAVFISQHENAANSIFDSADNIADDEDFFAENIHIIKYKLDGSLHYEMQSQHITHNDTTDIALVTEPVMALYGVANVKWHAQADTGKVYDHQQAIDLINNVTISKYENNQPNAALTFTTSSITVHPKDNTFSTGELVNIKTINTSTTATGMKANMDTDEVQLLKNVTTHYEK